MEQMLLKILLVVLAPFALSTYETTYVCKYSSECPQGMVCYQNVCTPIELMPPVGPPVDGIYYGPTTGEACMADVDCVMGLTCVPVPGGGHECALIEQ